ncbi:phosphatase PAP2 family protein [Sphingobacterium detergens]|uniref:PAP2 superfamily protein n=1 Tax=Sphingobacterium detergens TaxID=1145106 RepID=A0A420BG56_SPHD1|nr:phosphatase PAP2 family protein [Sphingobacterium detergens]RKE55667.1 PAP2 superfamily protein [Sphingobacterium detergens]
MNIVQFISTLFILWFVFLMFPILLSAQDSLALKTSSGMQFSAVDNHDFQLRKFVVPTALIAYGASSFAIPKMKKWDLQTRNEVLHKNPARTTIDNYTQYFPAAMVYGLNAFNVEGLHNFKDRTLIYLTSQLISGAIVFPAKQFIAEERPDGSNKKSFPSGHAATAFATAHFMYKEYRDKNVWLGLAGYPFAAFTGIYRVINNRHWVSDIVAGAGIGIASTELAYWLYPKMTALFKGGEQRPGQSAFIPYIGHNRFGINAVRSF